MAALYSPYISFCMKMKTYPFGVIFSKRLYRAEFSIGNFFSLTFMNSLRSMGVPKKKLRKSKERNLAPLDAWKIVLFTRSLVSNKFAVGGSSLEIDYILFLRKR